MKKYAVIVAGGKGERMKSNVPKQFLLLHNKPLLFYTLHTFLTAYSDLHIILVLPEEHMAKGRGIADAYFTGSHIELVSGGGTRFHSVQNGLSKIHMESIIFVHDGVRCLLTTGLVHRCYEAALQFGSAIPAIAPGDSIRMITGDGSKSLDRKIIRLVQTPQTFHSQILLEAYKTDYNDSFTDEAGVVEAFGVKVNLIEGEANNIKITEPIDLLLAENILNHLPAYKPVQND